MPPIADNTGKKKNRPKKWGKKIVREMDSGWGRMFHETLRFYLFIYIVKTWKVILWGKARGIPTM